MKLTLIIITCLFSATSFSADQKLGTKKQREIAADSFFMIVQCVKEKDKLRKDQHLDQVSLGDEIACLNDSLDNYNEKNK